MTPSGRQLITLRLGEFDCINKIPCGYFYASIVALCVPSFLMLLFGICGLSVCFPIIRNGGCLDCLKHCMVLPIGLILPPLVPLIKIGSKETYSRVHISSDTAFFKILKKPSIVQK